MARNQASFGLFIRFLNFCMVTNTNGGDPTESLLFAKQVFSVFISPEIKGSGSGSSRKEFPFVDVVFLSKVRPHL